MNLLPLAFTMGPTEWIVIAVIVLLILGPTQIPKLVKTFKKTRKEIKEAMNEEEEEKKSSVKKETADDAEKA
ncbi:MAG: twin-arginine translocase TatA/TatE family subunit [Lachnospiraceae bacterium]|nr:twin-arginine translocase TatA/TatE family subunit [Lachnospiraceae bacterium]